MFQKGKNTKQYALYAGKALFLKRQANTVLMNAGKRRAKKDIVRAMCQEKEKGTKQYAQYVGKALLLTQAANIALMSAGIKPNMTGLRHTKKDFAKIFTKMMI